MATAQQVVVVGAGVSGLTSALCLAEAGWPVRVWAAAMPLQTTSAVAGAVWAPPRPGSPKTLDWSAYSLRIFRELAGNPVTGVRMAPALTVGDKSAAEALPPGADLIADLRPADAPQGFDIAFRATLPMI
ncbi:MAG: D-amino-acid oxidase, partial [Mycobacterium sp.]|nr:D-amino-acid oxidase [Mycobacterium sp.]